MLSFWEKESFTNYDYLVLGGGIVGLSTAIELRSTKPQAKIAVVERGVFPSGASTKNAGFACFGSLTEVLADLEKMSDEQVFALVERRWQGLQLLRQRLGDSTIDYRNYGGYELLRSTQELTSLNHMDRVNNLLKPLFGKEVYRVADDEIAGLGFRPEGVKSLVFNQFEGQIHTGKMMKALQQLAGASQIDLITGAEVTELAEEGDGVIVQLKSGQNLRAAQLAVCTNAFTSQLMSVEPLHPGRGVVLVTKPIPGLRFEGTFHYDEGYYYFRNYQDRVIFGGGRNLDLAGEETTEFGAPEKILDRLKADLDHLILPGTHYEIDQVWSGIMAFGPTKQPLLRRLSERINVGVRLGGMGVAIGSLLGKELADLMTKSVNN